MTAKIAAALVAAQKSLKGVHKDARNKHHSYDYASSESIFLECRDALFDAGLVVLPRASSKRVEEDGTTWLVREYKILHAEGESMDAEQVWPVVPGNGRPLDKAIASAATASLAYFLRDLLLLPRVEKGVDLDDDERDKEPPPPKHPPPKKEPSANARENKLRAALRKVATLDAEKRAKAFRATEDAGALPVDDLDVLMAFIQGQDNIDAKRPPDAGMTPDEVALWERAVSLVEDGQREVAA